MKNNKTAISLIVLVITIIVLSILAATVIISLNNTNIIAQASSTVFKSDMSNYKEAYETYVTGQTIKDISFERESLNISYGSEEYDKIFGNVPDKYKEGLKVVNGKLVYETENENEKAMLEDLNMKAPKLISKDTTGSTVSPYIGYYADVDGNGTVDGVIFADLAYSASGQWVNTDGAFSYTAKATSGLKDYEVIQESYSATGYAAKPVLKANGRGTDRFYVMSLSDFTTTNYSTFYWYYSLHGSAVPSRVAATFGAGKQNTFNMISDWNGSNNQNAQDMWGAIKQKVYGLNSANDSITGKTESDVKWFVPSKAEWGAFGYAFGLTSSNYESLGLNDYYWASSLDDAEVANIAYFLEGFVGGSWLNEFIYVRLAATF